MERKALNSWNVAWAQSGSGLATSLLTLASPQVLDDVIEAGWAFNFGSSAGLMVLSCSWNILRRVETNKLLIAADFPRWMNKVTDVFGRKQKHLRRWLCQWLTQTPACSGSTRIHADWSEDCANLWWLRWKCFWEGVERERYKDSMLLACLSLTTVADLSVIL